MITLIPIEQVSVAHGALIVDAFNKFFILNGGEKNGAGAGWCVCPFEQVTEDPDGSRRKSWTQSC